MKKTLIILSVILVLLIGATVVFQVLNPPLPEIARPYTEQKATMLLWRYKSQLTEPIETGENGVQTLFLYGVLIEKESYSTALESGVVASFAYVDMFGKTMTASADGIYKETVQESGELIFDTYKTYFYDYTKSGFEPADKTDYDTPPEGTVKLYFNTNKGVIYKVISTEEFETTEFSEISQQIITVNNQTKGTES